MCSMELVPSLSQCIETVAKEAYWNLANKYMEGEAGDKELAGQIELLKAFRKQWILENLAAKARNI